MRSPLRLAGVAGLLQAFKQSDMAWIAADAHLANTVRPSGRVNCRSFLFMCIARILRILIARYLFHFDNELGDVPGVLAA